MATLPTPGGSDVWGADLNTAIKAMTNSVDASTDWSADLGYDLEFETTGTSLPSGWSWVNQGTSTFEQKHGLGIITPQNGSTGDGGQRMIVHAIPTATTWEATLKVGGPTDPVNYSGAGLVLRDSVSGKYSTWGRRCEDGNMIGSVMDWNALEVYAGRVNLGVGLIVPHVYFKIKKLSGGNHTFSWSLDGVAFRDHVSNRTPTATYDQLGFLVMAGNGAAPYPQPYPFHWLRVR